MSLKLNSFSKPFKKLLRSSGGSTAGRNSSGRITIYHRGGGAKRLLRNVDVKRNTESIGVVERIEYDPNRSSRLALVRWIEGVKPLSKNKKIKSIERIVLSPKTVEPITATVASKYSLSSLSCNADQRKRTCLPSGKKATTLVVGLPSGSSLSKSAFADNSAGNESSSTKDIFLSAFAPPKAKGESTNLPSGGSSALPRIALAGARPTFYAVQFGDEVQGLKELSLSEVQKWKKDSSIWDHRLKRKASVSWHSFSGTGSEHKGLKFLTNQGSTSPKLRVGPKSGGAKVDCTPVSYIIASNGLEPGKMVMNCERSIASRY